MVALPFRAAGAENLQKIGLDGNAMRKHETVVEFDHGLLVFPRLTRGLESPVVGITIPADCQPR
ncbi:hypothetical protein Thiowin_03814 [Thiorhodovibrio winogradskyi]|uniref:Uncharacterized protein n=1 Tax=Thiorhodovibrio winogradskyi TaxID=77007 RepID=A0ABZ0SCH3_9GAMM|nr:hypothetical protein [Thiorhodovibrio winogradskyi]